MVKSPSSTPSPASSAASTNIGSGATSRANPFSIDYILSSNEAAVAAAAAVSQKHQAEQALQMDLINQQRAQLMAAAAAVAGNQQQNHLSNLNLSLPQQQQLQQQLQRLPQSQHSPAMQPQIKPDQQQPQPHPNFLQFMVCMLLQQQQQQQTLHRQQQQAAAARQASEQQIAARSQQQQRQQQQAADLTPSAMDSLAVFARLAGLPNQGQTVRRDQVSLSPLVNNHMSIGKQASNSNKLISGQARHQPYPPHPASMSALVPETLMSHHHQRYVPSHLDSFLNQSRIGLNSSTASSPIQNCVKQPINSHLQAQTTTHHSQQKQQTNNLIQRQNGTANQGAHQSRSSVGERLDHLKPAHSYIGLIGMCILSSPEKRMVLNDIYHFILDNYPYYRNRGNGWRNSVRHNLSLNECFQKAGRAANGKGHYWTIHPANMEDFMMGDFRRRRAQRKVRRWNNMDVPSDESEDESMEDATKPPLPEHFKRSLEMHRRLALNYELGGVLRPSHLNQHSPTCRL